MHKKTVGVVALSGLVFMGLLSQNARTTSKLTAEDYAEIDQLYARYSHAIDAQTDDGWMYARVFTEDGEFEFGAPTGPVKGHEQLREMAKPNGIWDSAGQPRAWHFATNIMIEPTSEGAKGSAYVALIGDTESGQSVVTGKGIYTDLLVKTSGGWRFKKRSYIAETFPPDVTPSAQ